jgi:hypothetical protein
VRKSSALRVELLESRCLLNAPSPPAHVLVHDMSGGASACLPARGDTAKMSSQPGPACAAPAAAIGLDSPRGSPGTISVPPDSPSFALPPGQVLPEPSPPPAQVIIPHSEVLRQVGPVQVDAVAKPLTVSGVAQVSVAKEPVAASMRQAGDKTIVAASNTSAKESVEVQGLLAQPAATPVVAQGLEWQELSWLAARVTPAQRDGQEARTSSGQPAELVAAAAAEAPLTRHAMILGGNMPVALSSLQSSIKDFFEALGKSGAMLTGTHIDLVYSSGIMAAAAVLALEIVRRQARAAAPEAGPTSVPRLNSDTQG